MRPRLLPLALVPVLALVLGACGGSSGGGAKSSGGSGTRAPVTLPGTVADHGTEDVSTAGTAPTVEIDLGDTFFSPTFVRVAPGATVTVDLKNTGGTAHTFTIDSLGIDRELGPGETAQVQVAIGQADALRFFCRFHVASGMQGAFYVTPGATLTAPVSSTSIASSTSTGAGASTPGY